MAQLERAVQNANMLNVQSDLTFTQSANAEFALAITHYLGTLDTLTTVNFAFTNLTGTNSLSDFPPLTNDACTAYVDCN